MPSEQDLELSIQATGDSGFSHVPQIHTKRQLVDFIRFELNLGLTLAQYSKVANSTGATAQADEVVARATIAYDHAHDAFTHRRDLGKWQEYRLVLLR